jgi:hypothetical protein
VVGLTIIFPSKSGIFEWFTKKLNVRQKDAKSQVKIASQLRGLLICCHFSGHDTGQVFY